MPRPRDERGSASVALTLLLPILLTFAWVAMGAAMYHFGSTAAQSAAQTAASAAAAEHGTTTACEQVAAAFITTLGDALTDARVDCQRTATSATATITGTSLSLVPGWAPTVSQTATVPLERITR